LPLRSTEASARQSRALSNTKSEMNAPPAARLGRAAHDERSEQWPFDALQGTRAERACPVLPARIAQHFARR